MNLSPRGRRRGLLTAAAIAALAAAGCSSSASSTGSTPTQAASPRTTASAPAAMSRAAAQSAGVSWLGTADEASTSRFAVGMRVHQTGYTLLAPPESTTEPDVGLLKAPDGTCIGFGLRVWPQPGVLVNQQVGYQPNAVVTRTGPNTFTVAVEPSTATAVNLTTPVTSCASHPKATIVTDSRSVAALGDPAQIPVGTTRYIPGRTAWVAATSSLKADILATSSAPIRLPGFVPLTMTPSGLVIPAKYRTQLYVVGAPQIAADGNEFPRAAVK